MRGRETRVRVRVRVRATSNVSVDRARARHLHGGRRAYTLASPRASPAVDLASPNAVTQAAPAPYCISRILTSIPDPSSSRTIWAVSVSPKWYGYRMPGRNARAASATMSGVMV